MDGGLEGSMGCMNEWMGGWIMDGWMGGWTCKFLNTMDAYNTRFIISLQCYVFRPVS